MFRLNHRSIKVTLFSEIHIKIISKISLTYHQIAFRRFIYVTLLFYVITQAGHIKQICLFMSHDKLNRGHMGKK